MPVNLADSLADLVAHGFAAYADAFAGVTRRARGRFERREWREGLADAEERILLYRRCMDALVHEATALLGERLRDLGAWSEARARYAELVRERADAELAETFFNSLTRRMLGTVGIEPGVEFLGEAAAIAPGAPDAHAPRRLTTVGMRDPVLFTMVEQLLRLPGWRPPWEDFARDVRRVVQRLEAAAWRRGGSTRVDAMELLPSPCYRGQAAYLVGRAWAEHGGGFPIVVAVRHAESGLHVDAVLTTADDASVVFGFSWSYLHVEAPRPRALVEWLCGLMPNKRIDELYTTIGHNKHGKSELWRAIRRQLGAGDARFEFAPGAEGLVMAVFTLPALNVVFKIIKDTFGPPKRTTRREVMEKYHLVFVHDRVGRLADAQEFEQLELRASCFAPGLLDYLVSVAPATVTVDGERVVVAHCYTERRVTPLDVYLRAVDDEEQREAIVEYGNAIRDLAAAGIFTGDLLLKNFGVTRHGRVVFYDYDELCLLRECTFRALPDVDPYDELASEPLFHVGEHDIFPEEFAPFLVPRGPLRDVFLARHGDLLTPEFWTRMQERVDAGEVPDSFPYRAARRFPRP
jgi:isocitrate dehydrogenase kinase/phosphatase